MTLLRRIAPTLCALLILLAGDAAHAACTSPAAPEGNMIYNTDYHVMQFCNGTNWISMAGGTTSTGGVAMPSGGSGFFVLSTNTYTASSVTSLAAGNATCLTELTTNTGWWGYSTANANGQLISSKVRVFACRDGEGCNNLLPTTTYYFGNASKSSAGGGFFTTDSSGRGPGNSSSFAAVNYFYDDVEVWTGRRGYSSTLWDTTADYGLDTGGPHYGKTGYTDSGRWFFSSSAPSSSKRLICYVNP